MVVLEYDLACNYFIYRCLVLVYSSVSVS